MPMTTHSEPAVGLIGVVIEWTKKRMGTRLYCAP